MSLLVWAPCTRNPDGMPDFSPQASTKHHQTYSTQAYRSPMWNCDRGRSNANQLGTGVATWTKSKPHAAFFFLAKAPARHTFATCAS